MAGELGSKDRNPRDAGGCHPQLIMLSGGWQYLMTKSCIKLVNSEEVSLTAEAKAVRNCGTSVV